MSEPVPTKVTTYPSVSESPLTWEVMFASGVELNFLIPSSERQPIRDKTILMLTKRMIAPFVLGFEVKLF